MADHDSRRSGNPAPGTEKSAELGLIVGIGASAGGLSAFTAFLKQMPADSGMAFVLVQHLSPDHKSALTELLGRTTTMPVIEAEDGGLVEANNVYVIPPNATLTIEDRRLSVVRPAPPRERRRPIDTFFSSLAEDQGENAVCIILSGTGSDGTIGLKEIKESGGFALAQAEFDHEAMSGMPQSAASTGLVDEVMQVEAMPEKILAYKRHLAAMSGRKDAGGTRQDMAEHLKAIERLLRGKTGHDFSGYKESTVTRRIQRRMQVLQIGDVPEYIARLTKEPDQIGLLFRDLLIGVTKFFRDPDAFAVLEKTVIPKLLENKGAGDQVRIWVAGCATGEEVYSIAFLMREALERSVAQPKVQIFGTDIDDAAVAVARAGRYRKTTGISPERLERWFAEDGEEYCPVKDVREMCVFSTHSVVKDPPFSRLDLVSCRNLLIYMNSDLQDRVLRTFHYALKADGVLFLGPSEGVTRSVKFFTPLDKKHRIFQRKSDAPPGRSEILPPSAVQYAEPRAFVAAATPIQEDRIERIARRVLEKFSPAYVVVNERDEILRFSGSEVGRYLEPAAGIASLNLFGLLKKPLRAVVREAMGAAHASAEPALRDGVILRIDGRPQAVSVIAAQASEGKASAKLYVIAFRPTEMPGVEAKVANGGTNATVEALEHELHTTKVQLQSSIDELEIANEEMRSATEEYQSVNEELQSSNEELETAKEEMQSVNEELQTVNTEMQGKNEMLMRANSDLKNLLDSTEIATIFLDNDLRIKNFTPGMVEIFHLRESDRGRPVTDIVSQLNYADLRLDVRKVLRNLAVTEKEVRVADNGMTFIMRIRPYRTVDNVIDGVVITFMDISRHKKAEDYRALLMGELDHRVKNILAIVSAVITQTLRKSASPTDFATAMEGRISAISRAHSLLTQTGGKDEASLRDLIATELAPYDHRENRPRMAGPDIALTPQAGLTLGMAIHELASNAVKFGSLSAPDGRLSVEWSIVAGTPESVLKLVWSESGGPAVQKPSRTGFGSTLIVRSLTQEFGGKVDRDFAVTGLICTIDIPLAAEVGRLRTKEKEEGQ